MKIKLHPQLFHIPGLNRVTFKRKLGLDILFLLAVFALPTNFFNFLPGTLFVDTKLLYLIIGLLYAVFNIRNYFQLIRIPGANFLVLVVLFLFCRVVYSYSVNNISIVEIITIFRTNFSYPIIIFGFLLYGVKMDNERLYRFMFWIFFISLTTSFVYIISNLTGVNFYANVYKDYKTFNDTLIIQNLASISKYNPFVYVAGIFVVLTQAQLRKTYYVFIPLIVVILSNVRNQLLVYIVLLIFSLVLIKLSRFKFRFSKFVRFFIVVLLVLLFAGSVFQAHINRLMDKFGIDEVEQLDSEQYLERGTFKVRLDLIDDAQKQITNNFFLGNGYKRNARKGQNDYVVGTDTLVASVLYTEGYLGFLIRLLPIVFFLSFSVRNFKSKNKLLTYSSIIMFSIIIANIVNIVQTRIFTFYNEILLIFFLLMFLNYNNAKNEILYAKQLS